MNGMELLSGAIETAIGMILIALAGKMKWAQLRWFRFVLAGLLVTSFIVQQIVEFVGFHPIIPHFTTIMLLVIAVYISSDRWQKYEKELKKSVKVEAGNSEKMENEDEVAEKWRR